MFSTNLNEYEEKRAVRTKMLIGEEAYSKLQKARVLICGLGGVGGMVCEALARSGVINFRIVDFDKVSPSNSNRQLIANSQSVGAYKTDLWVERIKEIAPNAKVDARTIKIDEDNIDDLLKDVDAVVDCIDQVGAKLNLIKKAGKNEVLFLSAMGAANKKDPSRLRLSKLSNTYACPLARVIRQRLSKDKEGKKLAAKIRVVFSDEEKTCPFPNEEELKGKHMAPASMMMVPASMGLLLASALIEMILQEK